MQISDDIVRGALAPGATLDEMELARRFNVSRTPVREAVRLLVWSGHVEARPHRSAVVARPGMPQLADFRGPARARGAVRRLRRHAHEVGRARPACAY